jgi:hypothetical protein
VDDEHVTTWLGEERVRGRVTARIGRRGTELVAEFPNLGTFFSNADGTRARLEAARGANPRVLEKLGASAIGALARHLQGKLTFHAGAASLGSSAVVFLGESGAGKSTLAAALCTEAGFDLVADDTASIEVPDSTDTGVAIEVVPSQSAVWLLPSARVALGINYGSEGKVPVTLRVTAARSLTLIAMLHLVFDRDASAPILRRVRGQDALSLLSGSAIRFVIDRPEAQLSEFEQFRRVVQRCPIFELRRACSLDQLSRSVGIVRQLVARSNLSTSP